MTVKDDLRIDDFIAWLQGLPQDEPLPDTVPRLPGCDWDGCPINRWQNEQGAWVLTKAPWVERFVHAIDNVEGWPAWNMPASVVLKTALAVKEAL